MSVHATVAAVLFAIQMAQRQVRWFVEPYSDDAQDVEAAEFLEGCMDDMVHTWEDNVAQVFSMLKFGFSVCELVYKKRLGQSVGRNTPRSRFDDGRIGWRRWQHISPKSLDMADRWIYDDQDRLQGFRQLAAPHYQPVAIPLEKALLFRTTVEFDNPEGLSILRPMYQSWYYAENLSEVEAIAAERMGTGIPAMYLGTNLDTSDNANSDWAMAKDIVRNVRTDEQMGLVFPYPKMGLAPEGTGVLFELISPPSQGLIDFSELIDRHEKRMAMTVLAQFIFLGMLQVGTQALNQSSTDTFQMSIGAWSDSVAAVINRYAVPRLFALNAWNVEELPKIKHSDIGVPDLPALAEYINKLVGSQVLTPGMDLEQHLREAANLPEADVKAIEIEQQEQKERDAKAKAEALARLQGGQDEDKEPEDEEEEESADFFNLGIYDATRRIMKNNPGQGDSVKELANIWEGMSVSQISDAVIEDKKILVDESFALRLKSGGPKWERATNAYELELRRTYQTWADDTATALAKTEDQDDFDEELAAAVALLIGRLRQLGRRRLPEAYTLGLGGVPASPNGLGELSGIIASNDDYLTSSLGPDIQRKASARVQDDPLIRGDVTAMGAVLLTFLARAGSYSGAYWQVVQRGFSDRVKQEQEAQGEKVPVRWRLDYQAKHCDTCLAYGNREYDSWDDMMAMTGNAMPSYKTICDGNCRCWCEAYINGQWVRIWTHLAQRNPAAGLPLTAR
jgi:hypothetical protein